MSLCLSKEVNGYSLLMKKHFQPSLIGSVFICVKLQDQTLGLRVFI